MIWPVDSSVSQEYGSNPTADLPADSWLIRTFGNYQPNGHTGVDFPVHEGTPVKAVANGVVRHVGWYTGSYADNPYWISPSFAGFVLVIDHGDFVGIYAHLSGSPVAVGETVREGQTVAYSGNTGGSTGPHLHFEVLPDGWDFNNGMYGRVNPAQYFGAAAINAQSTTTKSGGLTVADINSITKQLNEIKAALAPINTSSGAVDLRQFIADGTRAAQAAEKNTGPINVSGGKQEGIRDFIAKGTRAAQAAEARLAALESVLGKALSEPGADLATLTAAAEAGASKALSNLSVTIEQGAAA